MFNASQTHQREHHGRGNWLSTVINPSTPDANYPLRAETNLSQHGPFSGSLYSFDASDALSPFSTPSFEAAQFDYTGDYHDIVRNAYGQPYTPSGPGPEDFARRLGPSSDDDLLASVHQALVNDRVAAETFSAPTQDLDREKPRRKARRNASSSKSNDVEKEVREHLLLEGLPFIINA